jgi:hypothetical protein
LSTIKVVQTTTSADGSVSHGSPTWVATREPERWQFTTNSNVTVLDAG